MGSQDPKGPQCTAIGPGPGEVTGLAELARCRLPIHTTGEHVNFLGMRWRNGGAAYTTPGQKMEVTSTQFFYVHSLLEVLRIAPDSWFYEHKIRQMTLNWPTLAERLARLMMAFGEPLPPPLRAAIQEDHSEY